MGDEIILNAIDGATGQYLVPPIPPAAAAAIARGRPTAVKSQASMRRLRGPAEVRRGWFSGHDMGRDGCPSPIPKAIPHAIYN